MFQLLGNWPLFIIWLTYILNSYNPEKESKWRMQIREAENKRNKIRFMKSRLAGITLHYIFFQTYHSSTKLSHDKRKTTKWGSVNCRWRYWSRMIACCLFDFSLKLCHFLICRIFHPGEVLPSNVSFTSDEA